MSLEITASARRDLDCLHDYVARAAGVDVARRFVRSLGHHLSRLANSGAPGTNQDTLRPGLRLVMHGPYKLFFEQTNEALRLLRVIHGARNVSPDELEGAAG